jgi:predicted transcriptional regulator
LIFEKIPKRLGKEHEWHVQKRKKELTNKLEQLDKKAKKTMLSPHESDMRHCLKVKLGQLLREQEIKWFLISKSD